MKTKIKAQIQSVMFFAVAVVLALSWSVARGDDLNPPSYRNDPLSVYAHWNLIPGTTILDLTAWNSVDDTDPATYLYTGFTPNPQVLPNGTAYDFQVPNFVDNMPIKYLRLQLTWQNTFQPPISVSSQALDGINSILGTVTFVSPVLPDASGVGAYQYYDIEYLPNPDFERINVLLPPDGLLSQVVIDTVSTVPEPATMMLLGLGGFLLRKKRRI